MTIDTSKSIQPNKYAPWMDDQEWQRASRVYNSTTDTQARNAAMEIMQKVEQDYMRRMSPATRIGAGFVQQQPAPTNTFTVDRVSDLAVLLDALSDYRSKQHDLALGEKCLAPATYNAVWSNYRAAMRLMYVVEKLIDSNYQKDQPVAATR